MNKVTTVGIDLAKRVFAQYISALRSHQGNRPLLAQKAEAHLSGRGWVLSEELAKRGCTGFRFLLTTVLAITI